LATKGIAPKIKNLVGQLDFTQEELEKTENSLAEAGVQLPQFSNVEGALARELQNPEECAAGAFDPDAIALTPERKKFLEENQAKIIKVQAMARRRIATKAVAKERQEQQIIAQTVSGITKLQAKVRSRIARKAYVEKLEHFKSPENIAKITKIQAIIKGRRVDKAYHDLGTI
jgi:hypothetical protein